MTTTLDTVISVRHVNLRQTRMRMSSMYSNDIELTLYCDTHANTSCIGHPTIILNDYDRPVTVYGYDPVLGS